MIRHILKKAGLKVINVSPDEDCIFHAVLLQISTFFCTVSLRQAVCEHMITNRNFYSALIDSSVNSFDDQMETLRQPAHWNSDAGDIVCLALCNMLCRRIVVLTTRSPTCKTTLTPSLSEITHSDIIIFLNHNHYSAIVPISQTSDIIFAPDLSNNTIDFDFPLYLKSVPVISSTSNSFNSPVLDTTQISRSPSTYHPSIIDSPTTQTHHPRPSHYSPTPAENFTTNNAHNNQRPGPTSSYVSTPYTVRDIQKDDPAIIDCVCSPTTAAIFSPSKTKDSQQHTVFNESASHTEPVLKNFTADNTPPGISTVPTKQFYVSLDTKTDERPDLTSTARSNSPMDDDPAIINFSICNHSSNFLPLDSHCSLLFNNFRRMQDKFIACLLHLTTLIIYHQKQFHTVS